MGLTFVWPRDRVRPTANKQGHFKEREDEMKMLDYHLHFAQLANEDQLRDAARRQTLGQPNSRGSRVFRLPFRHESRERGRR
jgi:hypothetical protein